MISSTLTELIARLNVVATGPERKTLKTQLIEVLREAIVTGLLPPTRASSSARSPIGSA